MVLQYQNVNVWESCKVRTELFSELMNIYTWLCINVGLETREYGRGDQSS
jgi:hypothetical protein